MEVLVFGNKDVEYDSHVYKLADRLKKDFPLVEFKNIDIGRDIPESRDKSLIIIDVVESIEKPVILSEKDIDKIELNKSISVHDFDLGFQLNYLKKIGKISKFTVIGIPMEAPVDYNLVQDIFKKLVAQDMQGS